MKKIEMILAALLLSVAAYQIEIPFIISPMLYLRLTSGEAESALM